MALVAGDIKFYLSGGGGNTDPLLGIGGAISSTEVTAPFNTVSRVNCTAGITEYRLIYIKNTNGTDDFADSKVYVTGNTTSTDDEVDIGLATEAVTTTVSAVANITTAPVGVTFSHPTTVGAGLALDGSTGLLAGGYKGIWLRRTVQKNANALVNNTITLRAEGAVTQNLVITYDLSGSPREQTTRGVGV